MESKQFIDLARARIDTMLADAELLVRALSAGATLAAAEDSHAIRTTDWALEATVRTQRRTAEINLAMQLALRDARKIAKDISTSLKIYELFDQNWATLQSEPGQHDRFAENCSPLMPDDLLPSH